MKISKSHYIINSIIMNDQIDREKQLVRALSRVEEVCESEIHRRTLSLLLRWKALVKTRRTSRSSVAVPEITPPTYATLAQRALSPVFRPNPMSAESDIISQRKESLFNVKIADHMSDNSARARNLLSQSETLVLSKEDARKHSFDAVKDESRWRTAMDRVSKLQNSKTTENVLETHLPDRIVDFFIVFGVYPPNELKQVDFDTLSSDQIEDLLASSDLFAGIVDRFPHEEYEDASVDDSWTNFAFPSGIMLSWDKRDPRFHFAVLTDAQGTKIYLSFLQFDQPMSQLLETTCKHSKELFAPRAICLVSHFPFFSVFRKMLSQIFLTAKDLKKSLELPVESVIKHICLEVPLPVPGEAVLKLTLRPSSPDDTIICKFPSIRPPLTSRFPLCLLFDILGLDSVLGLVASILCERKVLLHSNSLSSLTIVSESLFQLIFPFKWCSVYIPLVPETMLEAHQCPQPYIQGIHSKYLPLLTELDDIVLVDIDHDLLRCATSLPKLPRKSGEQLWKTLRDVLELRASDRDLISFGSEDPFDADVDVPGFDQDVYGAFLTFFSSLFSGYRKYLFVIDKVPLLNQKAFVESKSYLMDGTAEFLQLITRTRLFDEFLAEDISAFNLFHEFIATNVYSLLDEIIDRETKSVSVYPIPSPEKVNTNSNTLKALVESGELSAIPFHGRLVSELLSTQRKFTLKKKLQMDQFVRYHRMHHLESVQDEALPLKRYLQSVFLGDDIEPGQHTEILSQMRRKSIRTSFSDIIRQPLESGKSLCLSDSFDCFSDLFVAACDLCFEEKDFTSGVVLLDAGFGYYREMGSSRVYVGERVMGHRLWFELDFWKVSLESAVAKFLEGSGGSCHDFVFEWIIEAAQKMIQNQVDEDTVGDFVRLLAKEHRLGGKEKETLETLVQNIARTSKLQ